jgi:hypothetical protein
MDHVDELGRDGTGQALAEPLPARLRGGQGRLLPRANNTLGHAGIRARTVVQRPGDRLGIAKAITPAAQQLRPHGPQLASRSASSRRKYAVPCALVPGYLRARVPRAASAGQGACPGAERASMRAFIMNTFLVT